MVLGDHLEKKKSKFPWHASVSDSLELEINVAPDQMTAYSESFSVHPTGELPMMLLPENVFEFIGRKNLEVLITPNVIRSDENLKTLGPSDRSCYFDGERKLRFFKVYTMHNCKIECFSNFSRNMCGCVPFDFVRGPETRVCGITYDDVNCHEISKIDFRDYRPTGVFDSCSCLSPCNSVSYNLEIRESVFQGKE